MTIPVKWFHSGMTGAPSPGTATGTLISILDACLINGFNTQGIDSLTYDSNTGKCTATVNSGHGFEDNQVVLIEGANETEYNGEARVTVVDANTFTYVPATAPTAATATGTITAKAAPVGGWNKVFSDVNRGVYRSNDPSSPGYYLRVDDNVDVDGGYLDVFESMSDIDTGTGIWGSCKWRKGRNSGGIGMQEWSLVGDGRAFYFRVRHTSSSYARPKIYFFGDVVSFVPGDVYATAITGTTSNLSNTLPDYDGCITDYDNIASGLFRLARNQDGTAVDHPFETYGIKHSLGYPDSIAAGIVAAGGIPLIESGGVRGMFPGARMLLSSANNIVDSNHFCMEGRYHVAFTLDSWR